MISAFWWDWKKSIKLFSRSLFLRFFLNLKFEFLIVTNVKFELQLKQQNSKLKIMIRLIWSIKKSCCFNQDFFKMMSWLRMFVTKHQKLFRCFSSNMFIMIIWVMFNSKNSSTNWSWIDFFNKTRNNLFRLTKNRLTKNWVEISISVNNVVSTNLFWVFIWIFQFNWRSFTTMKSILLKKTNLTMTNFEIFWKKKFSNWRIRLRKFLNNFRMRFRSKIFNFSFRIDFRNRIRHCCHWCCRWQNLKLCSWLQTCWQFHQ